MSDYESSEAIREDIDETRRDMGRKIDAMQDQLSVDNLKAQAKDVVNEFATTTVDSISDYVRTNMGNVGYTVANALKRNPVPAALVGLGMGWLLIETLGQDSETTVRYPITKYPSSANYAGTRRYAPSRPYPSQRYGTHQTSDEPSVVSQMGETVSNAAHAVQENIGEWVGQAQERLNDVTTQAQGEAQRLRDEARLQAHLAGMDTHDQMADWQQQGRSYAQQASGSAQFYADQATDYVGHSADEAMGYMRDTAGQVSNYASHIGEQAQYYAQQTGQRAYEAGEQVAETIEENPIAFGAVALAVGAAIGMLLPQTRRENQWLGPYRDQVADTARTAASDVMTHAQEAVDEIRPEVERSAQKIVGDLRESGRTIVEDLKQAGETAKEEAKTVGNRAKEVVEQKSEEAEADVKKHVKTAETA